MNKRKPTLSVVALLPLWLAACGEATSADTEPMPEDTIEVAEIERNLPTPETEPEIVGEVDSACRADLAQPFVGQTLDLDSRTALLDAVEPQAIIRFLEPDDEVGDSADRDRLTIQTDEEGAIAEVFCG